MVEPLREYKTTTTGRFKFRRSRLGKMILMVEERKTPMRLWPPFGEDAYAEERFEWRDGTWEDVVALGLGVSSRESA